MATPLPIRVFVSWSHMHRSADPGDVERWFKQVYDFVKVLRKNGIDADVDLFHLHSPDIDWSTYGPTAIEDSEYVLIVTSGAYKARWKGDGDPKTGAGAAREANALKALFDQDRNQFTHKVKVILLPGVELTDIPLELQSAIQRFKVRSFDRAGVEALLRTLTGQPVWEEIGLGSVPVFPPRYVDELTSQNEKVAAAVGDHADAAAAIDHDEVAELRQQTAQPDRQMAQPTDEDEQRERIADRVVVQDVLAELEQQTPSQRAAAGQARAQSHWSQHLSVPHRRAVNAVGFSADGRLLATGSDDRTAEVWDVDERRRLRPFQHPLRHGTSVTMVAFSPVGGLVATVGGRTVRLWESSDGASEEFAHESDVSDVAFSPDGRLIATCCRRAEQQPPGTVRVWEVASREERPLPEPVPFGLGLAFSPDGTLLATADRVYGVRLWDLSIGERYRWFDDEDLKGDSGLTTDVSRPTFSPGGTLLAAGSASMKKAWVWDIESSHSKSFPHDQDNAGLMFSPDGHLLATLAPNQQVGVWELVSGGHVAALQHEGLTVNDMAFSPDNRVLATAASDNKVRLWDIARGRIEATIEHKASVVAVAFSPRGALLASASHNSAWVWKEGKQPFPRG